MGKWGDASFARKCDLTFKSLCTFSVHGVLRCPTKAGGSLWRIAEIAQHAKLPMSLWQEV